MGTKEPMNVDTLDERALLALIAEGDERAFERLFRFYATLLAALAMRMLRDEQAKQEVIQEVFLKIWINRDRLENVQQLQPWLRKITINECLMYIRRAASYREKLDLIALEEERYTTDCADHLHIKELTQAVERAVHAMPPQRRTIYEMSRIQGLTAKEISGKLGLSHGYVRNTLSAALTNIRERLAPYIDITLVIFLVIF